MLTMMLLIKLLMIFVFGYCSIYISCERYESYIHGYTCKSLCNGHYDICLTLIRMTTEKFMCLRNSMLCQMRCKRKAGNNMTLTLQKRKHLNNITYAGK